MTTCIIPVNFAERRRIALGQQQDFITMMCKLNVILENAVREMREAGACEGEIILALKAKGDDRNGSVVAMLQRLHDAVETQTVGDPA